MISRLIELAVKARWAVMAIVLIVAGVSLSNLSATTLRTWATMIALVIGLTTLSLLATYLMSKRFANSAKLTKKV